MKIIGWNNDLNKYKKITLKFDTFSLYYIVIDLHFVNLFFKTKIPANSSLSSSILKKFTSYS